MNWTVTISNIEHDQILIPIINGPFLVFGSCLCHQCHTWPISPTMLTSANWVRVYLGRMMQWQWNGTTVSSVVGSKTESARILYQVGIHICAWANKWHSPPKLKWHWDSRILLDKLHSWVYVPITNQAWSRIICSIRLDAWVLPCFSNKHRTYKFSTTIRLLPHATNKTNYSWLQCL